MSSEECIQFSFFLEENNKVSFFLVKYLASYMHNRGIETINFYCLRKFVPPAIVPSLELCLV